MGKIELEYKGGNPDSREAYFSKDISGPENEDVFVDNFVWNRSKSNQNLTDTRQGKGFNFYYARLAFEDKNCCDVYNEENPENIKSLGIIYEKVVVVINYIIEDEKKIRIISAWEDDDTILSDIYWKNKERNKYMKGTKKESFMNESRIQDTRFTSEVDEDEVFYSVSEKRYQSLLN